MWKDYSKSYIKNNRASSISIMAAVLVASFFLSLLCTLAYNFLRYDIEQIILDKGDWQARITADLNEYQINSIQKFDNVDRILVNSELSEKTKNGEKVIDIYFNDKSTIYKDVPKILEHFSLEQSAVSYNEFLLSRYLINNPHDKTPPLLLPFYLALLIVVSFSLILIIRNSFELSMKSRIHQLGILSSIGATPKQIRICLLQEAAVLSIVPMVIGGLLGVAASAGIIHAVNFFASDVAGRHVAVFQYSPYVLLITFVSAALTVLLSAWLPAGKLCKIPALQAIKNADDFKVKRKKHSRILLLIFGVEGELAGNSIKAHKKSLRICNISLLLSFLGFSIMLCFTTLSDISTRFTYFERYKDDWDIMMTVKNTAIQDFEQLEQLQSVSGVDDIVLYQKAEAMTVITDNQQSSQLYSLGGLEKINPDSVENGQVNVKVPVVIMDDDGFLNYCSSIGVRQSLDGAVVINRIWDSINSNFRYKQYIPFVDESSSKNILYDKDNLSEKFEVPVMAYTSETPVLREEYENYSLVHIIPLSLWESIFGQSTIAEADSYVRVMADENNSVENLNDLEKSLLESVQTYYEVESENRIEEKISNDRMISGLKIVLGAFCILLALIGIANVFFNTLGFIRQRKREFARYMSVGLTPKEMGEIFVIEAFVIAGKPLLVTLPVTAILVQLMINASYLDPMVFWAEAPVLPISLFALSIVAFVALAFYIGGRRLLNSNLGEALREDTV
ncbi:MAG: ABC transporter permease [Lachnospira sp.]